MEEDTDLFQRYLEELDREQAFYESLNWSITQLYHRIQKQLNDIDERKTQVQALINDALEAFSIYRR